MRQWRRNKPKDYNRVKRNQFLNRKKKVISKYGGKCVCCGLADWRFLTIDHPKGGGQKDRARFNRYHQYYAWLLKKLRKGYQIMCWNCNCAKSIFGECPHVSLCTR